MTKQNKHISPPDTTDEKPAGQSEVQTPDAKAAESVDEAAASASKEPEKPGTSGLPFANSKGETVREPRPKETGLDGKLKLRAKEVFASHKADVIYMTADGTMFIEGQYARMHAETLDDKKVLPINRKEV